jgi:spermidine/putrescine transport system permease protein
MKEHTSLSAHVIAVIAILVLVFLYLPIVVVAVYSLNPDSVNSFPMKGISLKWFVVMFQDKALMISLGHSLMVAVIATGCAILLGVPLAYAMYRFTFPGKALLEKIVLLPLILPGILTGIAMLSFFQVLGIHQSMFAVVIGHTTFLIATVMPQVYTRLCNMDKSIQEAALDLGATPLKSFFYVILPNVKTAIFSAALLSFTLSMDEIPVTYFLNGVFTTLPIEIWGMTHNGITPEVNAIATLILLCSLCMILLSTKLNKKED